MTIAPDAIIKVILPAKDLPDYATVTKRKGEAEYTLRKNLKVYRLDDNKPLEVEGCFLVGSGGHVNQVRPETELAWIVSAQSLVGQLLHDWEEDK